VTLLLAVTLTTAFSATARAELLRAGDTFPAWEMTDHAGRMVSSASLAGKSYLLWFYPKAMTPGCTAEGRGLRDEYAELSRRGVEVLGVSFDAPQDNARFVAAEGFPFRLLSDTDHAVALRVGAASSPTQAVASRISYLVGGDGKVIAAYGSVDPAAHAAQVLETIRKSGSKPHE
jgi:thioredoxin-dependent peroxiredoxin